MIICSKDAGAPVSITHNNGIYQLTVGKTHVTFNQASEVLEFLIEGGIDLEFAVIDVLNDMANHEEPFSRKHVHEMLAVSDVKLLEYFEGVDLDAGVIGNKTLIDRE